MTHPDTANIILKCPYLCCLVADALVAARHHAKLALEVALHHAVKRARNSIVTLRSILQGKPYLLSNDLEACSYPDLPKCFMPVKMKTVLRRKPIVSIVRNHR